MKWGNNPYPRKKINGKMHYVHRLLWEEAHGPIPEGMVIDHINGDPNDNRLENLRCVTRGQNKQNSTTQKGYYWDSRDGKWRAQFKHNKKLYSLGLYDKEEDARQAYLDKYKEILGEDFNVRI